MQTCEDCAYEAFGTAEMIAHRRRHKLGSVPSTNRQLRRFVGGHTDTRAVTERKTRTETVTPRNDGTTTVTTRNTGNLYEVPCDCGCGTMLVRRPQYVDVNHRMRAKRRRDEL